MKSYTVLRHVYTAKSPPSRGAWIEMELWRTFRVWLGSRPPRGGRGLKLKNTETASRTIAVAPLAGGVD